MDAYNQAIARCEEAVRLDPKLPAPYYMLGAAHDLLWQQETRASATPDDSRIQEHRRKATENYKKFLGLNLGDTDPLRRARPTALSSLLGLYIISGEKDEAFLEYANELAKAPSLKKRDLENLAAVYSRHERLDLTAAVLKRDLEADPSDAQTCHYLTLLYNDPAWKDGPRFDDRVGNLELCAAQSPSDPTGYFQLGTVLWDKAYRDQTLTDKQKLVYVERGLSHIDRALGLKKDFVEALVYKGLLLRLKAMAISDPALQNRLVDEAVALQKRAMALKAAGVPPHPGLATAMRPPPPRRPAANATWRCGRRGRGRHTGRGDSRGRRHPGAQEAQGRAPRVPRHRAVGAGAGRRHPRVHHRPRGEGRGREGPAQHPPAGPGRHRCCQAMGL